MPGRVVTARTLVRAFLSNHRTYIFMRAPMKAEPGGRSNRRPEELKNNPYLTSTSAIFVEQGKKLRVDLDGLIGELELLGYCIDAHGAEPRLLRIDDRGIVHPIPHPAVLGPQIRKDLTRRDELAAWSDFTSKNPFTVGFLNLLKVIEGTFLEDTPTNVYFPFTNGVVNVSAKSVQLEPYAKKYLVWASHVKPRAINLKAGNKKCMYDAFIRNLAGKDNLLQVRWALGYLMHDYFQPDRARIVLLYDEAASRGNHGRTGKDLLLASVENMRRTTVIDARNMNKENNRYIFGNVTEETQFIKISDPRYFTIFSDLFNRVQGVFPVEQKYKTEVYLKHTPKIAISSNIMFKADSSSERDRQFPLILKPFYRDMGHPTPVVKVHGKVFFKGWNDEDWNKFYITMFQCAQEYLRCKVMPPLKFDEINQQAYRQEFGPVAAFLKEHIIPNKPNDLNVYDLARIIIRDLDLDPEDTLLIREYTSKVAAAIQAYCKTFNWSITKTDKRIRYEGRDTTRKIYHIKPKNK